MSNMAWTLAKMNKQLNQAENLAKKSLQISPRNPRYWNTLGTVFSAQRRHAHALVCYYRAAALDPSFPKVNQRILTSFKDLSPSQISKLADIPLDLLEAPPEEPPAAGPEKLLVDPLNPKFEPSMGIKESPAQGAAAPRGQALPGFPKACATSGFPGAHPTAGPQNTTGSPGFLAAQAKGQASRSQAGATPGQSQTGPDQTQAGGGRQA